MKEAVVDVEVLKQQAPEFAAGHAGPVTGGR